jgi:prephenate dehydratase
MSHTFENTASNSLIAFQGEAGAYSQLACQQMMPSLTPLPCATFEDMYAAVSGGQADHAMVPIENSLAGRVADNHHLLPESGLHIIGEHFLRVNHTLLGVRGADKDNLVEVFSHVHALGQCRNILRRLAVKGHSYHDTAGAARHIAELGDKKFGAIASTLSAEIYDLDILEEEAEDADHNTTRFLLMSRDPQIPAQGTPTMMSFVFQVRNVPAALYKAMGGFATNGVNMTKLESYQLGGSFQATQFYADIEGHPDDKSVQLALEELDFYSTTVTILGVYPKSDFRDGL